MIFIQEGVFIVISPTCSEVKLKQEELILLPALIFNIQTKKAVKKTIIKFCLTTILKFLNIEGGKLCSLILLEDCWQ